MMIFNGHLMKKKVRSCYTRTRADDISITSLILPWHCKDVKSKRSKCDNLSHVVSFHRGRHGILRAARAARLFFSHSTNQILNLY